MFDLFFVFENVINNLLILIDCKYFVDCVIQISEMLLVQICDQFISISVLFVQVFFCEIMYEYMYMYQIIYLFFIMINVLFFYV